MGDPIVDIFYEEAAELLADFEAGLLELEETHGDVELLHRIFRAAHTIKGNAGMLGFDGIARFTHGLESLLDALRTGARPVTAEVIDALLVAGDLLRRMLRAAQSGDEAIDAERTLERLHALSESAASAPSDADATDAAVAVESAVGTGPAASIRVPVAKVDRLINLVGELVITQAMVARAAGTLASERFSALAEAVADMDRHARELHEQVLGMRMVPVRSLFARLPRLVRDVAAALGKQVVLEVTGEDTELDRTVIERIADPLTHLVRNAVDHGIETPDARRAASKAPAGRIALAAWQQGGSIFIEIADDGRGLDRELIVAKAIAAKLVAADEALTDEQVWALVFHPGLSTATHVTEVSGRGVGMDVVRRNVEALGGTIGIQTTPGLGTRFRIKLPLTLAIMDGQVLGVGAQQFILPLVAIRETVRPARGSVHTIGPAAELAVVHGVPVPIVRLHRLFGIAGATILGDGRVALILDVAGVVDLANARRTPLRAVA